MHMPLHHAPCNVLDLMLQSGAEAYFHTRTHADHHCAFHTSVDVNIAILPSKPGNMFCLC